MPTYETRSTPRTAALLVAGLIVVVAGTFGVVKTTTDYLLRQNAGSAAQRWASLLSRNLSDLEAIAAGERPSAASIAYLKGALSTGRLFRYEIISPRGNLQFASERDITLIDPSQSRASAVRAADTKEIVVKVDEGSSPSQPAFFSIAYLPVVADGSTVAVVGAYVDQTEQRDQFVAVFRSAAISLCILSFLAFAVPAAAWLHRTKQKQAADRRVVESVKRGEELALQAQAQHLHLEAALANMPHGFCMFDAEKRLLFCNARYAELYSLPERLLKPGTPLKEIVDYRHEIGNAPIDFEGYTNHDELQFRVGANSLFVFGLEDGRTIRLNHLSLKGGGYVATHEDVTEAVSAESRIRYMARHDALTDLPNRIAFRERLRDALAEAPSGSKLAVLCVDLDHFKGVNEALGHPAGDGLLSLVAGRLGECVHGGDAVARLGGDEFAIVQVGAEQPAGATDLAKRLLETLRLPHEIGGQPVEIGASIGIALAPDDGNDPDQLLRNAGMALFRAKADKRGGTCFFVPTMDADMQARRRLETGLRRALLNEEFELHYQPLVSVRDNAVTGFEALIRWRDPDRGLISPAEFIPFAEETGLIVPIGDWVIRRACADAANWPRNLRVAVNLSPRQFRDRHVVAVVFSALAASRLAASRLELEITESILLNPNDGTLGTLHQLRDFGVRISMDDFGTGYSSLSYLRSFPFDKIKIDQSFIRDLCTSDDSLAIVRAVTGLGAALGVTTTAEGVETAEQLECLRRERCTEVQGFFFGRPRPSADLDEFLSDPKWFGTAAPSAEPMRPKMVAV